MGRHGLTDMPHLASRVFGTPLAISRPKLDAILTVLAPRLGIVAPLADAREREYARDQGGDSQDDEDGLAVDDDGIACIQIIGTLVRRSMGMDALSGMSNYADIAAQIDEAVADPEVKGILLELDSPGGEVGGLFDLVAKIDAASSVKPVYASANEDAYSAAYAIACACDKIFVAQTGGVGSIGVVALHLDQSGADRKEGLAYTYVFAGDKKVDANPHAPLSARAHADLQADIDTLYESFVKTVAANRSLAQRDVRATEAGTFMGEGAVAAGLADKVGTLEDAKAALGAELKRRASMSLKAKAAVVLALAANVAAAESVTDEQILAEIAKTQKAHAEASEHAASLEKSAAEAADLLEKQGSEIKGLRGQLATKDADHAIEVAKTKAVAAGLLPMAKDVEDDARELFAAGKVELAKRTLDRHLEASRSKVSALGAPGVRAQEDAEPKTPLSKASVLEKAKKNAADLMAAGKNKRGQAAK